MWIAVVGEQGCASASYVTSLVNGRFDPEWEDDEGEYHLMVYASCDGGGVLHTMVTMFVKNMPAGDMVMPEEGSRFVLEASEGRAAVFIPDIAGRHLLRNKNVPGYTFMFGKGSLWEEYAGVLGEALSKCYGEKLHVEAIKLHENSPCRPKKKEPAPVYICGRATGNMNPVDTVVFADIDEALEYAKPRGFTVTAYPFRPKN